ncbi:MAG: ctaC [Gemmatimonadetes bacterium]|nr:ctaC [Gemmatimonadota bacterium]
MKSTGSLGRPHANGAATGTPSRAAAGRTRLGALALPLLLLAAGCGPDHLKHYPATTFAPVTSYAREQDWLFRYVLVLGVAVGIVVFAALAYVLVRFRHRPGAAEPQHVHGNTTLELAWTLIPAVILAFIAVPTVKAIFSTQAPAPANALHIVVMGKQWWWQFKYPVNGGRDTVLTANEIHVPVGRPVELILKSDNVLHSFWVPQMGGKRDLVPNHDNKLVFTPEEPGVYYGQCAEFCGDSHALMRMRMIAQTPEDFQRWLDNEASAAAEPADSAVMLGRQLVTSKPCVGCHTIKGTVMAGVTGPNLTHFGRRRTMAAGIMDNNAQNLATWLRDAPHVKPGSKMPDMKTLNLKDEEIPYIVAYLQSLQ